ncbi:hypothetical protein D3C85_1053770 [compost metagenome]
MVLEIVWFDHLGMARQVLPRGHQHAMGRGQLARHHPLGQLKATAYRGVEPLPDQIDLAIIEMPVRVDRRETPQELTQQRHDVQAPEDRAHADFKGPDRLTFGTGQIGHRILDRLQTRADLAEKQLTGLRQCQAAGAALKQPDAQARFQLGDTLADRRRGQAQAPGSFGKAADLGAAHEAFNAAKGFHGRHYKLLVYTDYRNYRLHSR